MTWNQYMHILALYVFAFQVVFFLSCLWFATKWEYFRALLIGSVTLILALAVGLTLARTYSPEAHYAILHNPVSVFLLQRFYYGVDFGALNWKLTLWNLIALGATIAWVNIYRHVYPAVQQRIYTLKKRLYEKSRNVPIPEVKNLFKFLDGDGFFFGLSAKGPVYLSRSSLTHHVQVVGPSGTGKTKSVLFPLAMQAVKNGIPLIFVDGKGDTGLISDFLAVDPQMLVFNPLNPDMSNSYNPLASSSDATELMNMLAVGLDIDAPGEAKYYSDVQKKYLSTLLSLFISTGKPFSFVDIIEFTNYPDSRAKTFELAKSRLYKEDMLNFLERLSKNQKELIGLTTLIDQLFVADDRISGLVNSYNPEIDIKSIMGSNARAIFSFSTGKKAQTNEALAKMLLADIANAVGERHATGKKDFMLLILDEFGQYASPSFDKFISTCRSANVGVVLSHQTNAQLQTKDGSDRLAQIVRENTATKVILRQSEEADFWAETFGTEKAFKHTEQTEGGTFGTQKISTMGTIREVDEFIVHPNTLRQLPVGRAVFKSAHNLPCVINCGMWPLHHAGEISVTKKAACASDGLALRGLRLKGNI